MLKKFNLLIVLTVSNLFAAERDLSRIRLDREAIMASYEFQQIANLSQEEKDAVLVAVTRGPSDLYDSEPIARALLAGADPRGLIGARPIYVTLTIAYNNVALMQLMLEKLDAASLKQEFFQHAQFFFVSEHPAMVDLAIAHGHVPDAQAFYSA